MARSEAWHSFSRRWRKLHLGVDADTHEVVAVELTQDDVGDVSEIMALLDPSRDQGARLWSHQTAHMMVRLSTTL